MTPGDPQRSTVYWAEYGAAAWALIFAFLHAAWAAGWYIALPQADAEWAFSRRWFWIYDLVVTAICVVAVFVALALVQPWGRRVPRWLLRVSIWTGAVLLVLRVAGSNLQAAYLMAVDRFTFKPMHLYELWFLLGAVLFGVSLRHFRRAGRRA